MNRTSGSRRNAALRTLSLAIACAVSGPVGATGLMEVWEGTLSHDREHAVARAAHSAAQPRREQAAALWRPTVGVNLGAGWGGAETSTRGAWFSAPGFGQSSGVGFNTSIDSGLATRLAVTAVQPLYNPARRVQQQQITLSVDLAELQWQASRQTLMLRTIERYLDLALAEESLRLLQQQREAVQRAATEAQDRFRIGTVAVTDTHEGQANLASVQARVLAAESDVIMKRGLLQDSTGNSLGPLTALLPSGTGGLPTAGELEDWLSAAQASNVDIRMQELSADLVAREVARHYRSAAPTVDLIAQASHDRLDGRGNYGSATNTDSRQMVGVQVSIPLYSGGMRSARAEEAAREAERATRDTARVRERIAQQLRAAWHGVRAGSLRIKALAEGMTAATARRDATQLGRSVGHRTTQDLLNAENDLAAARLAWTEARVRLIVDHSRLLALAGRLDEDALRDIDARLAPDQR